MQKLQILLCSIMRITSYYYKVLTYDFTDLSYQNPNYETQTISVLKWDKNIYLYKNMCEKYQKYKYKKINIKKSFDSEGFLRA